MMSGGAYHPGGEPGAEGVGGDVSGQVTVRNPLLCFICNDYYAEPCLLNCYHTFCARCLRSTDAESKITCPLCGQQTLLKEGMALPPPDMLMRQLIELANAENPPCSNCDKRDKSSMCFCSTCGQALCNPCRENTHRAKMFSTHEVVHMSKCAKETHRRFHVFQCVMHGEQYIMFSNTQKTMLCVNCFRDTPAEARLHCVDIDTAYTQCSRKLEKAVVSVCDLQNSVREGLMMFKTLLEELRQNMETEKHTINSFCQGMQEAIAKTHANMIMEVQRQFETKERQFRGQLVSLSTVLPLLQLHLLLCSSFSASANKYHFLDLAYPMMDRLASVSQLSHPLRPVQSSQIRTNYRSEFSHSLEPWVGKVAPAQPQQNIADIGTSTTGGAGMFESSQVPPSGTAHVHAPASKRQQSALRAKALEGEGPFSNHCRSFDSQLKELSQQLNGVKERLGELHRDVTLLRRAHTPPLVARFDHITRECTVLEEQLERHQVELERLKNVFDTLWEEQLCRIHVEQDIFQSQMSNILSLRSEVKQLSALAQQLEPYVKSLSMSERMVPAPAAMTDGGGQETSHHQLQSLLEHISMLQMDAASNYRMDGTQKVECRVHPGQSVTSPTENIMYVKDGKEVPVREGPRVRAGREQMSALLDASGNIVYTSRQQQTQPAHQQHTIMSQGLHTSDGTRDAKRGVLSQLIEKVRTKEDRKKSPVQEESRLILVRDRGKSDGRTAASGPDGSRGKLLNTQQSDDAKQSASTAAGKTATFRSGKGESTGSRYPASARETSKVASLYHTISGKVLGSRDVDRSEATSDVTTQASSSGHGLHHLPPPPPPSVARRPQQHCAVDLMSSVACMEVRERLENHLKEKLHHMMARRAARPAEERPPEESDYQRISEATTSPVAEGGAKQAVRAMVHHDPNTATSTTTSPHRHSEHSAKMVRLYPASDSEDVFYGNNERPADAADKSRKQNNSCESLTLSSASVNSRRSSVDLGDRKTFVVVIGGNKGAKSRLMQKQRSWETFPPKKRGAGDDRRKAYEKFGRDSKSLRGGLASSQSDGGEARGPSEPGPLKKADSFEGHEEAVRTLVAAVQENRSQQLQQQRKQSHSKSGPS